MTPNIIQTMKHTVKASVLTIRTDSALRPWSCGTSGFGLLGTEATTQLLPLLRWPHYPAMAAAKTSFCGAGGCAHEVLAEYLK
jgi:hypothetical protein